MSERVARANGHSSSMVTPMGWGGRGVVAPFFSAGEVMSYAPREEGAYRLME